MRGYRVGICGSVVVLSLLSAPSPVAAAGGVQWRREPGGVPTAVTVAAGRRIYVAGAMWAPPVMPGTQVHVKAMVVARFGPGGGLAWRRTWRRHAVGWSADGRAVAAAPGGGVFVGGTSDWYEDYWPVVWRYSASGRLLWRRTLPFSLERGEVVSLAADERGVVAAVRSAGSCCDDVRHDGALVALDRAGRLTWRADLEAPGISGTWDGIGGVAIGADGRVYAAGHVDRTHFDSPDDPRPDEDIVVQQLSRTGDVGWTRVMGDGSVKDDEDATGVAVRSGLVVVAASVDDWTRGWVGAFATDGEHRWAHGWGRGYLTDASAVTIAPWGSVYVATNHTVSGAGADRATTSASLRRYAPDGTFVRRRAADAYIRGVAASHALYLTVGRSLQRWGR